MMNFNNRKNKKVLSAVMIGVVVLLIASMIVPVLLSVL